VLLSLASAVHGTPQKSGFTKPQWSHTIPLCNTPKTSVLFGRLSPAKAHASVWAGNRSNAGENVESDSVSCLFGKVKGAFSIPLTAD